MKIVFTQPFRAQVRKFPLSVQRKLDKQITFLMSDLRHPSLHAKKYHEQLNIWQARVDRAVRIYFRIENDTYIMLEIKNHPK